MDVSSILESIRATAAAAGVVGAASLALPAMVRVLKSLYDTMGDSDLRERVFGAWASAQVLQDDCEAADRFSADQRSGRSDGG